MSCTGRMRMASILASMMTGTIAGLLTLVAPAWASSFVALGASETKGASIVELPALSAGTHASVATIEARAAPRSFAFAGQHAAPLQLIASAPASSSRSRRTLPPMIIRGGEVGVAFPRAAPSSAAVSGEGGWQSTPTEASAPTSGEQETAAPQSPPASVRQPQ
jgi:hypothetical protein